MSKNIRKRGSVYWYRITKDGKPFEGSLQTGNLGVAKERLEVIRKELTASRFGEKPRRTFAEAAVKFRNEHCRRLKPKSEKRYSVSLRNLADHFYATFLDEIGSAKLVEFEKARRAQGVTSTTIRRDLSCLSSLFSRAEEWEWVTFNPVKPFKRGRAIAGLKEGDPKTRYLTVAEEHLTIPAAPAKTKDAIGFAIDTGLRKEEQFSLLIGDLDLINRQLKIRAEVAKSGRERTVPLLPRAFEIAVRLSRGRDPGQPLFITMKGFRYSADSPTMYEALAKACRRAGVARTSWHDLRRTCGCRLLQDYGLSFDEVCAWLGHSDVRVTQRHYAFLHVEQLHKAIRRAELLVPVVPQIERTNIGTTTVQ